MFSAKLKKYRSELGLTQIEFSKKLDISRATLGHLEAGLRKPSENVLKNLSLYSGKSINWWMDIEDNKIINELNDLNLLLDYMLDTNLIKEDGSMDDEDRAYIQRMLDAEIKKKNLKRKTQD